MRPYLGPPWTDSCQIWCMEVFHHALPKYEEKKIMKMLKCKKKKKKEKKDDVTLWYSICILIRKAHRDFSLNVICAIQAWFIIILITVWWRTPAAMPHVRPTLWMVFSATHGTQLHQGNWIHEKYIFSMFLGNCRGQHFSMLIKLQDNKIAQNLELQEWILAKCVHWVDRFNTLKFYAYHLNKDYFWQPEILMYAKWIPSIVMCLQVTG